MLPTFTVARIFFGMLVDGSINISRTILNKRRKKGLVGGAFNDRRLPTCVKGEKSPSESRYPQFSCSNDVENEIDLTCPGRPLISINYATTALARAAADILFGFGTPEDAFLASEF